MAENFWHRQFETFWNFIWRRKKPQLVLLTSGVALATIGAARAIRVILSVQDGDRSADATLDLGTGSNLFIDIGLVLAGVAMALTATWMIVKDFQDNRRLADRHQTIVMWFRGLRNVAGENPANAVPKSVPGIRMLIDIDIRDYISEAKIADPAAALAKVRQLIPASIDARTTGADPADRSVVFAGLGSVPFTVLLGMLRGNQDKTFVLDWNRQEGEWKPVNADDDGEVFNIGQYNDEHGTEAVLVAALSYPVDMDNVHATLPGLPIYSFEREDISVTNHWSEAKQQRLAEKVRSFCANLASQGVGRVHLILSCQSSVAFNIGRAYDWRNLPELRVYEFQRDVKPSYPWCIRMPTGGQEMPEIEWARSKTP